MAHPEEGEEGREVYSTTKCIPTTDGRSVPVRRCIGGQLAELTYLNPFLVVDVLSTKSDDRRSRATGETSFHFPAHPHRGFIEIRYVISGRIAHQDSCGHHSITNAGGAQLFNTGRGVVHEETISFNESLLLFQIWVNMKHDLKKSTPPSFRVFQKEEIPLVTFDRNFPLCVARNLTTLFGWHFYDVEVATPDCVFRQWLPEKQNAFLYVYRGSVNVFSDDPENKVGQGSLAVLGAGRHVLVRGPGGFLLGSAPPVPDRVFQSGGFVMSTEADVKQSIDELNDGWRAMC